MEKRSIKERINDKIEQIQQFLSELPEVVPVSIEEYISSISKKAACERYAEKIIQALIDLAFLTVREKRLQSPEDELQAFKILEINNIISNSLSEKLQDAKRMRNIIFHEYGEIDDNIIYTSITEQLDKDAREFIKSIELSLNIK